jgi:hypothetical protein
MKTRTNLHALFALTCAVCLASAADAPAVSARFVDPQAPEHTEVRALGERAIERLVITLVNEVRGAVSSEAAEKLVDVCHLKALPLTGTVIRDMPRITAMKRTSLRLRNPANAPDEAEMLALKKVEKDLKEGVLPKVLMQQVDLPGGKSEWRVYRLVGTQQQCVSCHGSKDSMSEGLQATLNQRYPSDQATGYSVGQWRGLVRVTVADAPPPPPAKTTPTKKKS